MKKSVLCLCVCFVLILSACGTAPIPPSSSSSGKGGKPAWIDNLDSVYPKNQYIAAKGNGDNLDAAKRNAFSALISYFGQSISVDQSVSEVYQEAVKSGAAASWSNTTTVQSNISTSSSLDTLVGAEIKDTWDDFRGNYYAVAVMERAKTIQIYNDLIKSNLSMISNLTNMNQAQKNTLEGFSRYQFAAVVADINVSYENLLKVIGAAAPAGVKKGDDYRFESAEIAKSIPIAVKVSGDRQGRVQAALSKALTNMGFRSGGSNSRYVVDAKLVITEVQLANQPNKFARYEITADLNDTAVGQTLLPFSANGREGHTTLAEAENRALAAVERKINEEYKNLVSEYLAQALPKK